jgi:hypothetical protein
MQLRPAFYEGQEITDAVSNPPADLDERQGVAACRAPYGKCAGSDAEVRGGGFVVHKI